MLKKLQAVLVVGLLSATGAVYAAVPAGVQTAFTDMASDFSTVFGYAFTALIVIVTSMLAWRYTRKLGNKI